MNKEELININGIREDLYQAMQIGDITLSSKNSQELYDFMNYQDKEIDRLNNIINELEKSWKEEITRFTNFIQEDVSLIEINNIRQMLIQAREKDLYKLQELKGSDKE